MLRGSQGCVSFALMNGYAVKPLDASTWSEFALLVERHNGVWGGCWCMGFHAKGPGWGVSAALNRSEKEQLVAEGRAQAALVFEGGDCVGWCQFGPTRELPRIKSLKAYQAGLTGLPDWRITCFYVDKKHRGQGIARAALEGALDQIAQAGGGLVEAISEITTGREAPGRFLFSATVELFEQFGFTRGRQVGKHAWIVSRVVDPV